MFIRSDKITEAARLFNDAMDKLITLSNEVHPDEEMLRIAKRKLMWARRVDMLLPVQLAWDARLLTEYGKFIIDRNEEYFKTTPNQNLASFAVTRNDVNSSDIDRLVDTFRFEWDEKYSQDMKNYIWDLVQQLYQGYLNYGFARKTKT